MGAYGAEPIPEAPCDLASRVRIGTSGWSYDHWRERFYPAGMRHPQRLAYYATRFRTVEVNSTFYRLPSEQVVRRWAAAVPEGFAFAVKGSRYVTHVRRLADVDDEARSFMRRMLLLGPALHVVLWQLPPGLPVDARALEEFVALLPGTARHAVEFRSREWLTPPVHEVLAKHGVACVSVDSDLMPQDLTVTGGFAYVRLHGRSALGGEYPAAALRPWASFVSKLARQGTDAYVYFNNDANAYAPIDAERLIGLVGARMPGQRTDLSGHHAVARRTVGSDPDDAASNPPRPV